MANTIYHNLVIEAAPQKVYKAVSEPKHLENWWPLICSGAPTLDAEYNFNFTNDYDWYGKVAKCNPGNAFYIKMTKADADWNPTTFGFDLDATKNGTQVRFWHKDWPLCNEHFKIASFCWAMLLKGLKDYIEKGIILPFEERS